MRPFLLASIESTLAYIANPLAIVSLLILIIGGYHLFRWAYDEIFFCGYVLGIYEPPLPNVHDLGQHSLSDFGDFGPHSFPDLDDFREIGRDLALGWIEGHREFVEELTTVDLDEFEEGGDDSFDDDFANEYR
jgi:hypothetical protein